MSADPSSPQRQDQSSTVSEIEFLSDHATSTHDPPDEESGQSPGRLRESTESLLPVEDASYYSSAMQQVAEASYSADEGELDALQDWDTDYLGDVQAIKYMVDDSPHPSPLLTSTPSFRENRPPPAPLDAIDQLGKDLSFVERVKKLSHISGAAYCPNDVLGGWDCGLHCDRVPGMHSVELFQDAQTEISGFVGVHDELDNDGSGSIVVAFRGSKTLTNWINNLKANSRPLPWGPSLPDASTDNADGFEPESPILVHSGFLIDYESVRDQVIHRVSTLQSRYPDSQIVVTGHSLGGALANLCAFELAQSSSPRLAQILLMTFESPRVGNSAFARALSRALRDGAHSHYRITNGRDLVVRLPPRRLGYQHAVREYFIDGESFLRCTKERGEDERCSCGRLSNSIKDHVLYAAWGITFGSPCPPSHHHHHHDDIAIVDGDGGQLPDPSSSHCQLF